jgi:cyclopropane fatty-acyl-phospholipid synthase-like methyltransferase
MTDADLGAHLVHDRYTRSNRYDPDWVVANAMGPNPLWLLECLLDALPIEPGTRVLDLGCGRGLTSVFLARELGAQVWATDLWIGATDNFERFRDAGVDDVVYPIHAEAHDLPYAEGFFDVIVSIDSYQYFGTDDTYLSYLLRFLRPGGRLGMVDPALFRELGTEVPAALAHIWQWQGLPFHGPEWWRTHWAKTGLVTVDVADAVPDGWKDWLRWSEITGPLADARWKREAAANEVELLTIDQGELIGFTRIVATKR